MYYGRGFVMVPESIRRIARPTNTIVAATAREGVYLVRERKGYKNGMPVNGAVVGHIVDGRYVAKAAADAASPKRLSLREITYKRYGTVALADLVGGGLYSDLKGKYAPEDARAIYVVALLRAAYGDVKDYQLGDRYEKSFASVLHPGAAMSKSAVCRLVESIGMDYRGVHGFMEARLRREVGDRAAVVIDGMLKENTSSVNTFSGFSYKGRIKGVSDVSIIYAVDPATREPLCMKVYKGNLPDASSFSDFLGEFAIERGLIVADKGFPLDAGQATFSGGRVGFVRPLKRSAKAPSRLGLYASLSPLDGSDGGILCSKGSEEGEDGETRYYYLFRDLARSGKEESDYVARKAKKGGFSRADYDARKAKFGTVVFLSNMDLTPGSVYEYYKLRWEIELVFKTYKSVLSQPTTREHDDWSVIGSEFINFLSTIITVRMQNKISALKADLKMGYSEAIDKLSGIVKATVEGDGGAWRTCKLTKAEAELMEKLGI